MKNVTNKPLTHTELCHLTAKRFLKDIALIEYKCTVMSEEPDVLVYDSYARTTLYEIKTSRDDYWKDWVKPHRIYQKKSIHRGLEIIDTLYYSIGESRYYVCPADLIQIDDLPEGWGLIWYKNNKFYMKRMSEKFKRNIGLESRLLINALKRVNEERLDNVIIKAYLNKPEKKDIIEEEDEEECF